MQEIMIIMTKDKR